MDRISEIQDRLQQFAAERDWSQYHDPKNLSMAVASEAGELAALFRWVRNDESDEFVSSEKNRDEVAGEVADIAIFLLLLCGRTGIDFAAAIEAKIAKDELNHPAELTRGHARRVRPKGKGK